jgi:NhaP-type Na+/H+ or K+/H+ antiporter
MLLTSTPHSSPRARRAVFMLGLVFLVLALVWPMLADAGNLSLSGDARDTVHGFLFGVAFGLLLLWIYVRARSRR